MKEKHISVSEELHKRLMDLAKKNGRTMRGQLEIMIKQAEEK